MRALLSVYDQRGIVDLATGLQEIGCELISTGGTGSRLVEAGLKVTPVSDVTKSPEILAGRVKTLHPSIHGGILARRDQEDDLTVLREHGIDLIDIVVVNFYPFLEVVSSGKVAPEAALENIDVGGPALLRAAAKNYRDVVVLGDPDDYEDVLAELLRYSAVREKTRAKLAAKAFALTSAYDAYIAAWLSKTSGEDFPSQFSLPLTKVQDLRYGENLHQRAALYTDIPRTNESMTPVTVTGASVRSTVRSCLSITISTWMRLGPWSTTLPHPQSLLLNTQIRQGSPRDVTFSTRTKRPTAATRLRPTEALLGSIEGWTRRQLRPWWASTLKPSSPQVSAGRPFVFSDGRRRFDF